MVRKVILMLLLGLCTVAVAKDDVDEADKTPGLKVGQKVPDFVLVDQNKAKVQLSGLLKNGPVAIVFHRSAKW